MTVVIGVGNSGLDAWAGPFHVAAVAIDILPFNRAIGRYLKDTKKLSDKRRRKAVPLIKEHALATEVVEVPVWKVDLGIVNEWRIAVSRAIRLVRGKLEDDKQQVLINGPNDIDLIRLIRASNSDISFKVEGVTKYPAIMAAATLAKTARNDAMIGLSSEYPEYGWERNLGFRTPEHRRACDEYGVTSHHRKIPPLKNCKTYNPKGEWFNETQ